MIKRKTWSLALVCALALGIVGLTGCSSAQPDAPVAAPTAAEESPATAAETADEEPDAPVAAPADAEAPTNSLEGVTVKVGCSATFVPYESIEMNTDGTKGHVGMNIDLVRAIVEQNGGEVEFVDMPFKSLMAAMQSKQIDFSIGGMAPTEERKKSADFSEIYFYPRNAIVYRSADSYPDLASLDGKTVAYAFGTNYQQVVEEGVPNVQGVGIQGSPACIEEVKSSRADACVIDGAGAAEFLKVNEGLSMSLLDKTDDCFAIAFPKESPYYETVNHTLKTMMENGELDEIIKAHLNEQFILD